MKNVWLLMEGLLLLGWMTTATGCPSCPYEERCTGNTLETCWLGPDQMVGDPAEERIECSGANSACVTLDDRNALCAMDAEATCSASLEPSCQDDLLVSCQEGYQVAIDCAADGNVCGVLGDVARCFLEPAETCDPETHSWRCEENAVVQCIDGYVAHDRCDAGLTCTEYSNEYGHSAYCGD